MFPRLIALVVVAAMVAACSKSEPPPASKPTAPANESKAPVAPRTSSGEVDAATRERLARQEAAARLFEKNVPEPPAPKSPPPATPVATPTKKAAPAVAAPPSADAPPKVEAQAPKPVEKPEPAKESPPPVQQPPAAAPRTDVAAARPAPAPAAAPAGPKLVSRIDPEFPREALQAGIEQGRVNARMTLDASGNVTRVEILDATPRRVFDRAVIRALSQWRYTEGTAGRTVEMEIAFALGKR